MKKRSRTRRDERRTAAALKAWTTRRAMGWRPGQAREPLEIRAGRRADYAALSTSELLALLPGEQGYLDTHTSGMQHRYAERRLRAIEEELRSRDIDEHVLTGARFLEVLEDDETMERYAIAREGEPATEEGALTFAPEDFRLDPAA